MNNDYYHYMKLFASGMDPQQVRTEVGESIRMARVEVGLSQAQLADILDRRQAYISDLENGKAEPGAALLVQLSTIFRKPIYYFFPNVATWGHEQPRKVDELTPEESELISKIRELESGISQHLAIRLINTLIEVSKEGEDYFNRLV